MRRSRLLPLLCLLFLVGCTLIPQPSTPTPLPTASATPPLSQPAVQAPASPPSPTASPVPGAPGVLRLTFPTPAPDPVSLWRPPLYDIPWALSPFDHFYFARPIAADEVNWPLADYRYGGVFFSTDIIHTGIDIDARRGSPVLAAAPGRVVWAGYGLFQGSNSPNDPYGLAVTIQHDFGWQGRQLYTVYAHLDQIDAVQGQRVNTGERIGVVGNTGNTTGPHLHFEVRVEDNSFYSTRNPELWLAPPQGWGVLVGQLRNTNGSILTGQTVKVDSLDGKRRWEVNAYGGQTVRSDEYYQENIVLSDLPAGDYLITIEYKEKETHQTRVTIHPGAVTYFRFRGAYGFNFRLPPTPAPTQFVP